MAVQQWMDEMDGGDEGEIEGNCRKEKLRGSSSRYSFFSSPLVTMAGKQVSGDGLSASLAGMSKNQLYDIMSQMKVRQYLYLLATLVFQ